MTAGRLRRALIGLIASIGALVVYVRTLYPGVVGGRDTAKFQFIGRILGTPHNPGYPLYVLITHVFSYVPIGSVAYRINLFSAVCGAAACALMALVFRRLGASALASIGLAWAFAFGPTFWSQATQAEVYTLAATLLAGVLLALVTWRETRTDRSLLTAIALAGLSLAHHTTLAMLSPALVAFVLATDPATIRRPKILLATLGFTILGLLPYAYILIRTHTGAPYLESQAHSLRELIDVIRSRQFASWFGVFTWHDVLTARLPAIGALVREELSWVGVGAALVGAVTWVRRRDPLLWLVAIGVTAIVVFAANYGAGDIEVFLIPALQLLWMAVAVGVVTIGGWLHRPVLVPALVTIGLALAFVTGNWKANDHSRRLAEGQFLAAVLEAVPDHTSFVADHSTVDLVLLYGLYGDGVGARRDLTYVAQDRLTAIAEARRGRAVYVFDKSRGLLDGLGIEFAPVPLSGLGVIDDLCEWTHGETVILAGLPAEWWRAHRTAASARCFDPPRPAVERRDDVVALVGRAGRGLLQGVVAEATALTVGPPEAPVPVAIEASIARAVIHGGPLDLACDGCALYAVLGADGSIIERHRLTPAADYRVPLRYGLSPLYRVTHASLCEAVGNLGWTDVRSLMTTGVVDWRIDNYRTAPSSVDLVMEGGAGGDVTAGALVKTAGPPEATFTSTATKGLPSDLPAGLRARFQDGGARATWLHVDVHDQGQFVEMRLPFSGAPSVAWLRAVVDLNNPKRATICDGATR